MIFLNGYEFMIQSNPESRYCRDLAQMLSEHIRNYIDICLLWNTSKLMAMKAFWNEIFLKTYEQWRSYTQAHPGTGPGINLFGPGIKNWQESCDYLLINGS